MQAQSAMTRDVMYVTPNYSLVTAYRWMTTWRVRHLPVVSKGSVVGILSDRDVLIHSSRVDDNVVVPSINVSEAMTYSPMTIQRSTTVSKAAELMIQHKIDALPVVDANGSLAGLVTSSDLLALLVGDQELQGARVLPFEFRVRDAAAVA